MSHDLHVADIAKFYVMIFSYDLYVLVISWSPSARRAQVAAVIA